MAAVTNSISNTDPHFQINALKMAIQTGLQPKDLNGIQLKPDEATRMLRLHIFQSPFRPDRSASSKEQFQQGIRLLLEQGASLFIADLFPNREWDPSSMSSKLPQSTECGDVDAQEEIETYSVFLQFDVFRVFINFMKGNPGLANVQKALALTTPEAYAKGETLIFCHHIETGKRDEQHPRSGDTVVHLKIRELYDRYHPDYDLVKASLENGEQIINSLRLQGYDINIKNADGDTPSMLLNILDSEK